MRKKADLEKKSKERHSTSRAQLGRLTAVLTLGRGGGVEGVGGNRRSREVHRKVIGV